jgi:ABC-type transport system substrate-binding protein
VAVQQMAHGRQYHRGEVPPPLSHDQTVAARLLEDAGWVDLDEDGIRERDGERFHIELLVSPEEAKAAVFVQRELANVGVEVEIQQLALNMVRRRISEGDFDATIRLLGIGPGGRYGAAALYGTESVLGYANGEVAALLEAASNMPSTDSVDALYRELWPHFERDLPMTYLSPGVQAFVVHRRILGLETGTRAAPVANMEYLWIEEER